MELLLLLGLGAFLLNRPGTTVTTPPPPGPKNGGGGNGGGNGGGGGGDLAPLITSELILPHVKVGNKDVVVAQLPLPAGSFNKAVVCNRPGGEARVADIQRKYDRYLKAFILFRNTPAIIKVTNLGLLRAANVGRRKRLYQNALQFHLTQCSL